MVAAKNAAAAMATGKVETATTETLDVGETTDEVVKAPTRSVVARPRLPVAMAAAPKPPKVVPQLGGATGTWCGKEGHISTNCTEKLCNRCNGRGHTADVCPTSKEEAVLAVTGEVGARVDIGDDGTVQALAFKTEVTREYGDYFCTMGDGESAWQVGDEAWICDSRASTHMTPSADCMINCRTSATTYFPCPLSSKTVTFSKEAPPGLLTGSSQSVRSCFRRVGLCSTFTATGSTAEVGKMPAMCSPRGNSPTRLRLTPTTSTALLDTLTRFSSARPQSSNESSSRGSCWSASSALCRKFFANVFSGPRTHGQIRTSGVFFC